MMLSLGTCYTCYLGFGRRKHIKIEFLNCLCYKGMFCIFQYMIYTSFVSKMRVSILKTTRRTTLIAAYMYVFWILFESCLPFSNVYHNNVLSPFRLQGKFSF
ncbi:hypothetical protein Hanom_Chr03g00181501 [Helianthus anomalus]